MKAWGKSQLRKLHVRNRYEERTRQLKHTVGYGPCSSTASYKEKGKRETRTRRKQPKDHYMRRARYFELVLLSINLSMYGGKDSEDSNETRWNETQSSWTNTDIVNGNEMYNLEMADLIWNLKTPSTLIPTAKPDPELWTMKMLRMMCAAQTPTFLQVQRLNKGDVCNLNSTMLIDHVS